MMAEEEIQARPTTGKVANVIVAGDEKDDDDGDEFLVEEKPKDTLDLLTEAPTAKTDVRISPRAWGGVEVLYLSCFYKRLLLWRPVARSTGRWSNRSWRRRRNSRRRTTRLVGRRGWKL